MTILLYFFFSKSIPPSTGIYDECNILLTTSIGGKNMKKITIVAIALIAICFVSGGYALYNNGIVDIANTPTSDSIAEDSVNPNSESSSNNENPPTTDVSKSLEIISNSLEPVLKLLDYSSDYSAVTPIIQSIIHSMHLKDMILQTNLPNVQNVGNTSPMVW